MERFVQLHLLTAYPPANLNRDDLGRPKTALVGGAERLRVSSQSLKRAWRTSDVFRQFKESSMGKRTKRVGEEYIFPELSKVFPEEEAIAWVRDVLEVYGEVDSAGKEENKKRDIYLKQLVFISPEEIKTLTTFVETLIQSQNTEPSEEIKEILDLRAARDKAKGNTKKKKHSQLIEQLKHHLLIPTPKAVDIGLFGRMLASSPSYNVEAACQVAHAITVHKVAVEDDFYTAVDDLNRGEEDVGAGHMGDTEFGAGLFYLYLCIDRRLLLENLGGDTDLARRTLSALIESAATVAPTGKQNSFGSRARASYILCEKGDTQPRNLSVAFLKPAEAHGDGLLANAIAALEDERDRLDQAYGDGDADAKVMDTVKREGSLHDVIAYATEDLEND